MVFKGFLDDGSKGKRVLDKFHMISMRLFMYGRDIFGILVSDRYLFNSLLYIELS